MRRAKIVCTLGPASESPEAIAALIAAGMDCARLNFSHGAHETHAAIAGRVRAAAAAAGRPVAILADLSGPKMRIGRFAKGPIELVKGARFTLTTRDEPGDAARVSVTYEPLPQDVAPGDALLLDDGRLRLRVEAIEGDDVHTRVEVGGPLSDRKGLNLPGSKLSAPSLSEKDRVDLRFAVETLGVDYVALSFVRSAADLVQARELAGGVPLIAKVEKPEAVAVLGEICDAADGVMVARGDLGVELGPEKVPLLQKRIIREVNARGKIVITATQMLDSMVKSPRPTRAEAADVANTVLDGSDALMLSNETAAGDYPREAVEMMDTLIREVEREAGTAPAAPSLTGEWGFANAAARAGAVMSGALPLVAIVVLTHEGRSAALLSEYRPQCPIVALTPSEAGARRMALEWGVVPRVAAAPSTPEAAVELAVRSARELGLGEAGQSIAVVLGWPPTEETNTVKLHRL